MDSCISGNVFLAFDLRRLPENICETEGYRNGKLEILIIHCSKMKQDTFKGITKLALSGKDLNTLCIWDVMHTIARLTLKCNHIRKMRKIRKKLWRDEKILDYPIFKEMKTDNTLSFVHPNSYKLFHYLLLFSLSTTCIKRLLSKRLNKKCLNFWSI